MQAHESDASTGSWEYYEATLIAFPNMAPEYFIANAQNELETEGWVNCAYRELSPTPTAWLPEHLFIDHMRRNSA